MWSAAISDIIGPMATTVHRKLTFYAWRDGLKRRPFDRLAAAKAIKDLAGDPDSVVEIDGTLVAALVSAVGTPTKPTRFQLLPLRDYDNRPLRFRPGSALSAITLASGDYTSDVAHIAIWPDGYAAYDAHGFAPGPQRLAAYLRETCDERVDFLALTTESCSTTSSRSTVSRPSSSASPAPRRPSARSTPIRAYSPG
jgi:hypothetical protein